MVGIVIRILALIACFLFASGFAAGAGKAFDEKKWSDFGFNLVLSTCFCTGIYVIIRMWCGIL